MSNAYNPEHVVVRGDSDRSQAPMRVVVCETPNGQWAGVVVAGATVGATMLYLQLSRIAQALESLAGACTP